MKSKVDDYVCRVPKGGTRKGCGGGAKVITLDKAVKRISKDVARALKHAEEAKIASRKTLKPGDPYRQRKGETDAEYFSRIADIK